MRGKNLIKFFKALEVLSKPEGATIKEMAEHLEVDRRTVYRMIELIEEFGFPLYDEIPPLEKEKRWKFEESYLKKLPNIKLPDLNLTLSETLSLYLLKGEESLFQHTDIEKYINAAFGKLSLFVSEDIVKQLKGIRALFIPSSKFAKDYTGKEEIIERLMHAMLQKKTCEVTYHSFYDDQMKTFKVDPLHFFEHAGGLYLFVNATTYNEIRTLAVERIQEITPTNSTFGCPSHFNPEEALGSAFDIVYDDPIKVTIWFSPDQARYIKERKWSRTQKIEDQEDGSIILSMNTSGWWDVKKWVLSYGAEAEVLEPEKLRKEIIEELKAATENYKENF